MDVIGNTKKVFYTLSIAFTPFKYGVSDQCLGMGGGLKASPRYMAVLGPNKAYVCYFQVICRYLKGWKFLIRFWKLTELLTFSYQENISRKFQTKNCFKKGQYWALFFANILFFIAKKDSSIKIEFYSGSRGTLFIFLGS